MVRDSRDLFNLLKLNSSETLSECVTVSARAGEYQYTADAAAVGAASETCGFFIVADADQIVKVEMTELDVSCGGGDGGGLVVVSVYRYVKKVKG